MIPAVNHMGTNRLQTIQGDVNPLYDEIVKRFREAAGVPVLLNTSFNLSTEPIVASPENAFSTFSNSDIDLLVRDTFILNK